MKAPLPRPAAVVLALLVTVVGCRRAPVRDFRPAEAPARAELVRRSLAELSPGMVVDAFTPRGERAEVHLDEYEIPRGHVWVAFEADVTLAEPLDVPNREGFVHTLGGPQFRVEDAHRRASLGRLFGPGRREGRVHVTGKCLLEDLEPGWEVRAFDRGAP